MLAGAEESALIGRSSQRSIGENFAAFRADQASGFQPVGRQLILDHAAVGTGGLG